MNYDEQIERLHEEKNDLLEEKAGHSQALGKVATRLKTTRPRDYGSARNKADLQEREEIAADIESIDAEVRVIKSDIARLERKRTDHHKTLTFVVPLVAARHSRFPTEDIATNVERSLEILEEINKALSKK